jgi:putative membrane protein
MRLIALPAAWPTTALAHAGDHSIDLASGAVILALVLAAGLYAEALRQNAPLRPRHAAAFGAGWLALALALLSPLDRAAAESFAAHMLQHELLMVVAPPLLILGRPFTTLAATLHAQVLRLAAFPLRLPPLAAWGLHAFALWLWHVPRLFDAGLESDAVHALQHGCFFWTALLFWWTVFRRLRTGAAVFYLLATLIHSGALAALLTFAATPLYASATLQDQQLGGLIMWVPAGYAMVLAGVLALNRLLKLST